MFKKLKKILMVLLIVPMMFVFGACKNKDDDGDKTKNPTTQTPGNQNPSNPDNPDDGGADSVTDGFLVNFDYNLPENYRVVENYSVNKEVGENVTLPTIQDVNLNKYFLGWYDKTTDEKIEESVTGEDQETINLEARWNETELKNYYYTPGLTFEITTDLEETAIVAVSGFDGTAKNLILPKLYEVEEDVSLSVRMIADEAFKELDIENVYYSAEGMIVGNNAFYGSNLSLFNFEKTIYVGEYSFANTQLESVTLGVLTETILSNAFANCLMLESVDLSTVSLLDTIPQAMFVGCENLTEVKTSSSIKNLELAAFSGCSKLANLDFLDGIISISANAFKDCVAIKSLVIPASVTEISSTAFDGVSIDNLGVYNLLAETSQHTFESVYGDLSKAKNVEILGSNVSCVTENYFAGKATLNSLVMADSVVTIENNAFSGCVNLSSIEFSSELDISTFNTNAVVDTAWYKNLNEVTYIGNALFFVPNTTTGEFVVKSGTKVISASVFATNKNITKVTIPSSVEIISANAFNGCSALATVEILDGSNLKTIARNAFKNCESLTGEFNIPKSVTNIAAEAFSGTKISAFIVENGSTAYASVDGVLFSNDMTKLHLYPATKTDSVYVIPSSVSLIKEYSFINNSNLKAIIINSNLSFESITGYTNAINNMNNGGEFYILSSNTNVKYKSYDLNVVLCYLLDDEDISYEKAGDVYRFSILEGTSNDFANEYYFVKLNDSETDLYFVLEIKNVSGETFVIKSVTQVK